jgi:anti-sigma regulatory factor (Ser/Thr protein kinase)
VGQVTTPGGVVHVEDLAWIRVDHASAVGTARRAVAALAARLGIPDARVSEIELVVSEVADNQLKHAGSGSLLVRAFRSERAPGLCLVGIDAGPGMADFGIAAQDGHSTAGSLGIGLGAVLRLSDSWDVHTEKGVGTVLVAGFGNCDQVLPGDRAADGAGLTRPMSGQEDCGDACALRRDGEVVTGLIADGLGHGPLAATASRAAVRSFLDAAPGSPGVLLAGVHRALQGTRGAAVAIAQIRTGTELCYAGIGNIGGHLFSGEQRRRLTSMPGIVGGNARPPREFDYTLDPDTVVVLHSDGVSEKLTVPATGGLRRRTPMVVAATILRDHGVRNDDAGVLVLRPEPLR